MQVIVNIVLQAASALGITEAALKLLGVFAGLGLSLYLGKALKIWVQAYRTDRQKADVEGARKDAAAASQKAQAESDRLKDIDGR